MSRTFYDALLWHMERHNTKISDLAKGAGISEGSIKMIRTRPGSGTRAETGQKIAAFYGKTLEQFMRCEEAPEDENTFLALVRLLSPEEQAILLRQVRGMIGSRD